MKMTPDDIRQHKDLGAFFADLGGDVVRLLEDLRGFGDAMLYHGTNEDMPGNPSLSLAMQGILFEDAVRKLAIAVGSELPRLEEMEASSNPAPGSEDLYNLALDREEQWITGATTKPRICWVCGGSIRNRDNYVEVAPVIHTACFYDQKKVDLDQPTTCQLCLRPLDLATDEVVTHVDENDQRVAVHKTCHDKAITTFGDDYDQDH